MPRDLDKARKGFIRDDLPDGALMENGLRNQTTSAERPYGKSTIYGKDGEHNTPYMTRWWIGRLRLHVFYRGDADPDPHDHPWPFWTFPLTPYVEEVTKITGTGYKQTRRVVPAFWPSYRAATHTHRVLGRFDPEKTAMYIPNPPGSGIVPQWRPGKIVTLVWRGKSERPWGFLKNRDGKWCWIAWKEYVFGNGKSAPCE